MKSVSCQNSSWLSLVHQRGTEIVSVLNIIPECSHTAHTSQEFQYSEVLVTLHRLVIITETWPSLEAANSTHTGLSKFHFRIDDIESNKPREIFG